MLRYFDRAANEISEQVYATLSANPGYKWIDLTEVTARTLGGFKRGFQISTIWLGLDYASDCGTGHLPVIFETLVFPLYGERRISREVAGRRSCTLPEARQDHADLVKEFAAKMANHWFTAGRVHYRSGVDCR